jgi:hypothetical protein
MARSCAGGSAVSPVELAGDRLRATASAAASVSVGRSRLPPANRLYRMASLTIGGQAGGFGK